MEDRKARLAALAAKAGRSTGSNDDVISHNDDGPAVTTTEQQQLHDGDDNNNDKSHRSYPDDNTAPKKRKLHFRNYIPSDPTLTTNHNVTNVTEHTEIKIQLPNANTTTSTTAPTTKSPLQLALEKARSEILNTATKTAATNKSVSKLQADGGSTGHNNSMLSISKIANEQLKPKINADLKRNIQSKLQLLEKRTQKALVSILRERLEQEATVQSSNE